MALKAAGVNGDVDHREVLRVSVVLYSNKLYGAPDYEVEIVEARPVVEH